jgi:tryptophanyl-tRNA synthetase
MASDPARVRKTDPGNPDICPVFEFHKLFSEDATIQLVDTECRRAGIGCFDCKKRVAGAIIRRVGPVREQIERHLEHPANLQDVLRDGCARARAVAAETMRDVRAAMQMPAL